MLLGSGAWPRKLGIRANLASHRGCVNTIQWNEENSLLVTGSDDCALVIIASRVSAARIQRVFTLFSERAVRVERRQLQTSSTS
jgi:hypothetical protein